MTLISNFTSTFSKNAKKCQKMHFFFKSVKKKVWRMWLNRDFVKSVQKLWQNGNIVSLTSIFGYNFTHFLRNIAFSQVKRLSYLLELFFGTFWQNLRKILGKDFPQSPKHWQKMAKNAFFYHKWAVFAKTGKNLKKASVLCFLHSLPPSSCQVSEKSSERFLR